ncbi:MAG: hypothetical protein HY706_16575 [Candidatus Hydrogenedentes bacterium]|nr:hypothetical protein [Candidatus Hydrogenedentota bacterium]
MDDVASLRAAIEDLEQRIHEVSRERVELERRCHILEKLAHRDPTTGLRTEHYLRGRIGEEIGRSLRYSSPAALITLCPPGESLEVIPRLGERLVDELRATDHIFGLSGGSLAILLLETPSEGAEKVIERIRLMLEQFIRGFGHTVTCFPLDSQVAEEFLSVAMQRHNQVAQRLHPEAPTSAPAH